VDLKGTASDGVDWIGLDLILDPVVGFCEYGNELSDFVKDRGVPDQLSDCPLLKKVSCLPWNVFTATSFLIRYQSFYYSALSLNRVEKIGSVAKEKLYGCLSAWLTCLSCIAEVAGPIFSCE
jgi:hypothetical protein